MVGHRKEGRYLPPLFLTRLLWRVSGAVRRRDQSALMVTKGAAATHAGELAGFPRNPLDYLIRNRTTETPADPLARGHPTVIGLLAYRTALRINRHCRGLIERPAVRVSCRARVGPRSRVRSTCSSAAQASPRSPPTALDRPSSTTHAAALQPRVPGPVPTQATCVSSSVSSLDCRRLQYQSTNWPTPLSLM